MRAGAEVTLDVGFIHKYGTLALLKPHKPRIGRWHFRGLFETRGHFMRTTREDRVGDWECGDWRAEQQTGGSLPVPGRYSERTVAATCQSQRRCFGRVPTWMGPTVGGNARKARVCYRFLLSMAESLRT